MSELLHEVRDATEPSAASLARVKAQVRATLAGEPPRAHALRALPDPDRGAMSRVRLRVAESLVRTRSGPPWGAVVAATALVTAAVFFAVRAPEQAPEHAPERAPVAAASPTPPRAAPSPAETAPAPGDVEPSVVRRAAAREIKAFGQADAAMAERTLAALGPALAPCLGGPLKVSLAVDVEGHTTGVSLEGASPEVEACVRPILMGASFGAVEGLRAGPREQVTGGVLRFQLGLSQ